jgi:alpha-galactosidase
VRRTLAAAAAVLVVVAAVAAGSVPGPTVPAPSSGRPVLGWNSWNEYGCGVTQEGVEAAADQLISTGLAKAGYRTVIVDDCWFDSQRAPDGSLRADPHTFPSGMAALGAYLHSKGLRFGLYESPATRTCAQLNGTYPGSTGSAGHVVQDARTFAAWGVDLLKYDWCGAPGLGDQAAAFTAMRNALRATGRPITYLINPNSGVAGPPPGSVGDWSGLADSVRISNDVVPSWRVGAGPAGDQGIAEVLDGIPYRPGPTPDLDMLVAGLPGIRDASAQTQIRMWAMAGAPLILGSAPAGLSPGVRALLTDPQLLWIDSDRSPPARPDGRGWSRTLSDGSVARALVNTSAEPVTVDGVVLAPHASSLTITPGAF